MEKSVQLAEAQDKNTFETLHPEPQKIQAEQQKFSTIY